MYTYQPYHPYINHISTNYFIHTSFNPNIYICIYICIYNPYIPRYMFIHAYRQHWIRGPPQSIPRHGLRCDALSRQRAISAISASGAAAWRNAVGGRAWRAVKLGNPYVNGDWWLNNKWWWLMMNIWWFGTCFIFPYTGNVIIPTDFHIFQRFLRSWNHQPDMVL